MLTPSPSVLRCLVERFEALHRTAATPEILRSRDDAVYTLRVSTGTRDIDSALTAAAVQLVRAASAATA